LVKKKADQGKCVEEDGALSVLKRALKKLRGDYP